MKTTGRSWRADQQSQRSSKKQPSANRAEGDHSQHSYALGLDCLGLQQPTGRNMNRDEILRREHLAYHGWQDRPDDDLPNRPEPDDLSSPQARRAWQQAESVACSR